MSLSKDLSKPGPERGVRFYQFGDFQLDPVKRVLRRGGDPVPLTPKVFETLLVLVRHSGRVVEKDELLSEIWPDTFVEEGNLSQNIFILRKTLGQSGETRTFIETIPKHGYRFTAEVKELRNEGASVAVEEDTGTNVVAGETEDNGFTDDERYAARAKVLADNGRWEKSDLTRTPNGSLKLISTAHTPLASRLSNFGRENFKAVGLGLLSCLILDVTFSPDAKRLAFVRLDPSTLESRLMLANIDGTGEQQLATYQRPGEFVGDGPAWSPDGKVIIWPLRTGEANHSNLTLSAIRVAD